MSEILLIILIIGFAASVISTVRAVRASRGRATPERKRHRPFEDAFDRTPRTFGKRKPNHYFEKITPPDVPVFPVDPYL